MDYNNSGEEGVWATIILGKRVHGLKQHWGIGCMG